MGTTFLHPAANHMTISSASCGQFGRHLMVRSVNDGGSDGVATVGYGQAEGESERRSPGRQRDASLQAVANLTARQQVRVQREGSAPRVRPTSPRTWTAPNRRKPFGSGPMSFAQGLTKGHSVGISAAGYGAADPRDGSSGPSASASEHFGPPGKFCARIAGGCAA